MASSPALSHSLSSSEPTTQKAVRLSEALLAKSSEQLKQVRLPRYDRTKVKNGIVHIGVGGFHRSHQALYLDNYIEQQLAQKAQQPWRASGESAA